MNPLVLYYPAKPYQVTQPWGVPNDAYLQFGFSRHNGIDFAVDTDGVVQAMSPGEVIETGYIPTGAGNYVVYKTRNVLCEGVVCDVCFYYMHAKEILVKVGDKVEIGTNLIVADNTGFSTGPHTHITAYRLLKDSVVRLDTDPTANHSFDHSRYFNGFYAEDYGKEYLFTHNIYIGDRSAEVVALQTKLQKLGFFPAIMAPTGYYGTITKAAVYAFQKKHVAVDWLSKVAVWANQGDAVLSLTKAALNRL